MSTKSGGRGDRPEMLHEAIDRRAEGGEVRLDLGEVGRGVLRLGHEGRGGGVEAGDVAVRGKGGKEVSDAFQEPVQEDETQRTVPRCSRSP